MATVLSQLKSIIKKFEVRIEKLKDDYAEWYGVAEGSLDRKFGEQLDETLDVAHRIDTHGKENEGIALVQTLLSAFQKLSRSIEKLSEFYESEDRIDDLATLQLFEKAVVLAETSTSALTVKFSNSPEIFDTLPFLISQYADAKEFWWLNVRDWNNRNKPPGHIEQVKASIPALSKVPGKTPFFDARAGDLVIIAETGKSIQALGRVKTPAVRNQKNNFDVEVVYRFNTRPSFNELRALPVIGKSKVLDSSRKLSGISNPEFFDVIDATELKQKSKIALTNNTLHRTIVDNDLTYGDDLLSFTKDVNAFATLLALEETKPPLAVALFGQWGSGKTFFMNQLRSVIRDLSNHQGFKKVVDATLATENREKPFCKGVVQIEFNAWSYLDSNLWAGLISTIFQRLDNYIENNTEGDELKAAIKKELTEKLEMVSEKKKAIASEQATLISDRRKLEEELKETKETRDKVLEDITAKTLKDLRAEALKDAEKVAGDLRKKLNDFGVTDEVITTINPQNLYDEVNSWATFARNVIKLRPGYRIFFGGAAFLFLYLIFDPGGYVKEVMDTVSRIGISAIVVIAPLVLKFYTTIKDYNKILQPVIKFKNSFNERVKEAEFNYTTKLQQLDLELQKKATQLTEIEHKLKVLKDEMGDIQSDLDTSITRQAFFRFINKRNTDGFYEKHLGLISTIRHDFQTLSNLFTGSILEAQNDDDNEEKKKKEKESAEAFRQKFKIPLDRVILYVDDLDRCPDEKVMEVLQAVHLLMAYPLFIVVVGVDQRCVYNALTYKNLKQYGELIKVNSNGNDKGKDKAKVKSDNQEDDNMLIDFIRPAEYLEKIFQIPFHLSEPTPRSIGEMINSLLKNQVYDEKVEKGKETVEPVLEAIEIGEKVDAILNLAVHVAQNEPEQPTQKTVEKKTTYLPPEKLKISSAELKYLEQMAILIGTNPRAVKRYINIYKIIRAHELLSYRETAKVEDFLKIMFILAINNRKHGVIEEFYKYCLNNRAKKFKDFAAEGHMTSVRQLITNNLTLAALMEFTGDEYSAYIPLVRRFSFNPLTN